MLATSFLLGVLATLPLGPAGYSIVENTIEAGPKKGLFSLLELQIVEFLYLFLSVIFLGQLEKIPYFETMSSAITIVVLILFGALTLIEVQTKSSELKRINAKRTFFWALLNPGILLIYITFLSSFKEAGLKALIPFQLGSIVTLLILVILSTFSREKLLSKMTGIKTWVGIVFISIGTVKLITHL